MNNNRAIILDMDETLEHGVTVNQTSMMTLRPNLDQLIAKLQEAKAQGIDIVLCTTAQTHWVERFLELKPEFKALFDTRLTFDNESYWKNYREIIDLIGYEDYDLASGKPVTTFGYDSILFIDDNKAEADRLKRLFELANGKLEKDVTYFSGFGFNGGTLPLLHILGYQKAARQNPEVAQKLEEYLETERNNPGCLMMCSAINNFMSKEFSIGFTSVDEEYSAEYGLFRKKLSSFKRDFAIMKSKIEQQTGERLFGNSESELAELMTYLATDRNYPYEGIESSNRERLEQLIQTAIDTNSRLSEAKKLKENYTMKEQPEETL